MAIRKQSKVPRRNKLKRIVNKLYWMILSVIYGFRKLLFLWPRPEGLFQGVKIKIGDWLRRSMKALRHR